MWKGTVKSLHPRRYVASIWVCVWAEVSGLTHTSPSLTTPPVSDWLRALHVKDAWSPLPPSKSPQPYSLRVTSYCHVSPVTVVTGHQSRWTDYYNTIQFTNLCSEVAGSNPVKVFKFCEFCLVKNKWLSRHWTWTPNELPFLRFCSIVGFRYCDKLSSSTLTPINIRPIPHILLKKYIAYATGL